MQRQRFSASSCRQWHHLAVTGSTAAGSLSVYIDGVLAAFDRPALAAPLGRYLQMPFCRKRCKFCSFRVDTSVAADSPECRRQLLTA